MHYALARNLPGKSANKFKLVLFYCLDEIMNALLKHSGLIEAALLILEHMHNAFIVSHCIFLLQIQGLLLRHLFPTSLDACQHQRLSLISNFPSNARAITIR